MAATSSSTTTPFLTMMSATTTRIRGDIGSGDTVVVIVAGIHGNEPAGLEAAARVLDDLRAPGIALSARVVVVAGNVRGLAVSERYAVRDLNRGWSEAQLARLRAQPFSALHAEDLEQRELADTIDAITAGHARVVLVDCHTTSAPGVPFVLYGNKPEARAFVAGFPIPVISGIVDKVEGVLSEFASSRGHVAFSVEGGQHDAPEARDALEAIIWLTLKNAGVVDGADIYVDAAHDVLDAMRGDLPRMVDVVSRHAISADDDFVMERGFRCIDRIKKGQLLARDKNGELRAEEDGVVVLPLYQKLGSDGFFWGKEVRASSSSS
jgi:predicted deacylase